MTFRAANNADEACAELSGLTDETRIRFDHCGEQALGYMARSLVQTTIPHRAWGGQNFQRSNGQLRLVMTAHPDHGLPYGKYPRLLLAWLTRQAKITGCRELELPNSQNRLLAEFGIRATGGVNGSLTVFKAQAIRLVTCTVNVEWEDKRGQEDIGYRLAYRRRLWWETAEQGEQRFWITLSQDFYDEIAASSVPFDFRVLQALRSPLACDLYIWATYRVRSLPTPLLLSWASLSRQFGAAYCREIDFRRRVESSIKDIRKIWPGLRTHSSRAGLRLYPGAPHVRPFAVWPANAREGE
ncbi:MAG: hypothetical protein CMN28_12290 [Salinisphaeraceae bacterium]|nr:hypothetical protein [Salinisphaeraceae bacterium]